MRIILKGTKIVLNNAIRQFVNDKFSHVERFIKTFNRDPGKPEKGKDKVELFIEIGRTSSHHNKGNVFRAEAQILLMGKDFRAESEREDLHIAINEAKEDLERQIKSYKGKLMSFETRKEKI